MIRKTLFLATSLALAAGRPPEVPFDKITIDLGANETCAFVDVNKDGKLDIVSGENWFEAPAWKKHPFRELFYTNNYIDAFSDLIIDINGDGYPDIVTASWFSKGVRYWLHPGKSGKPWTPQPVQEGFNVEFAFQVDIDNDGKANEVLPQFGNTNAPLSWYEFVKGAPVKHQVSTKSYGHGIGAGDLNGDGRTDILTPMGWFEAPANPRSGEWKWHGDWEDTKQGLGSLGFMHVLDVDGDGKNDIVTSKAHDYGIFWLKNLGDGKWQESMIDDSWSQAHSTTLVDLNGDGKKDLLTGKRFMAHNGKDPGEREPLGIYWYEYKRTPDGARIEWVKHTVDYSTRTGGGMQIPAADIDGDGDVDFAVGGKSGVYLFINKTK
ncbi:MAG: VCBS repeat-containing protein [Acidobacteria bacterium]|nr:VCBS repeat-containing protein [Acidobacteriota bacterium]